MLEMRKKAGRKPKIKKEQAQTFKDLHFRGYSMDSIAKQYNVSNACVSLSIKKLRDGGFEK